MTNTVNVLLAYVGPETMLPLASVFAAAVGGLLFCWRWIARGVRNAFSAAFGSRRPDDAASSSPLADELPDGRSAGR